MSNAVTLWMCMEDMRFAPTVINRCTSPVNHPDCRWLTVIEPVEGA